MSDNIKRMLAERAAAEAKAAEARKEPPDNATPESIAATDEMFAIIDKAAPFMDEGSIPSEWRPSDKIKLLYFTIATSPFYTRRKRMEAVRVIGQLLDKSRALWVAGLHPDPFRNTDSPWDDPTKAVQ